jgi:hypothetical protein
MKIHRFRYASASDRPVRAGRIKSQLLFRCLLILGVASIVLLVGCNLGGSSSNGGGANTSPVLTNSGYTPASGDTSTSFTFSVDYEDVDGDSPTTIQVNIDGSASALTLASGSADNGTYQYSTTLSAGSHNYFFYCEDGQGGSDREPGSGTATGPTVTSVPNTLSGSINYTGSVGVSGSQPLRIDVWSTPGMSLADSEEFTGAPFDFSFDLDPDNYTLTMYIDLDQSGNMSEDDVFSIYDGIYFLDDYDTIDLTGTDQDVGTLALDDSNIFGFYETFEDGTADGWFTDPASDPRWQVTGGQYVMTGEGDDDLAVAVYNRTGVADFTLHCDGLEQLAGNLDEGDWGLFFRFDIGTFTGYALGITNDGYWGLYSLVNGSETLLEYDTFDPGNDTITISCVGDAITIYVNGIEELAGDASAHDSGYIGLYAWDDIVSGGPQQYAYDDLWLVLH